MLVIDASVFNKLFLDEPDQPLARNLFRTALTTGIPLASPSLLLYEAMAVALHYDIRFEEIDHLLSAQRKVGMLLIEPDMDTWQIAHKIATSGDAKSGHPSLQDSIYHAVAIAANGLLVTADARHYKKTIGFGNIATLDNWREAYPL